MAQLKKTSLRRLRQITYFSVSQVPERCIGIFNVSNEWTIHVEQNDGRQSGVKKQNSKKGFESLELGGIFMASKFSARRVSGPTRTSQSARPNRIQRDQPSAAAEHTLLPLLRGPPGPGGRTKPPALPWQQLKKPAARTAAASTTRISKG